MLTPLILMVTGVLGADLKVDHITIGARDLKQLQSKFEAAGIHSEYGGKHTNGLTEMAIASFRNGSYLELIAAQKPTGAAAHYWGKFIDANAGPCAWAISVPDIAAQGLGVTPTKSGRMRPDGVRLEWESASVGPEAQGTFFPFLIHDLTPRERRAFPQGKPSAGRYEGVGLVVLGVRDLEASIARYRASFHLGEPVRDEADLEMAVRVAWFPGTPVMLAAPLRAESALGVRLAEFGEAPFAFVLDMAPRTFGGYVGWSSQWAGNRIHWIEMPGTKYPWIGVRAPATSR